MASRVDNHGIPLGPDDKAAWWTGVIYQIYPRSFQDTTGNGVGDLPGITSRLDYLANGLGVDALWISPFFPSPMADFGYDVSDYTDVDPLFGSLDDADALVARAHELGLRVIIDWVPNHSSHRHRWFLESRSSRDNPKRDWYVWRDAAPDGGPPNNWLSMFGGSAWEFDELTDQCYLHTFLKEQPELNWRNPDVEAAMHDTLRFWLDRGVDGFRIDVAHFLMKDPEMRSNPPSVGNESDQKTKHHYDAQEHIHDHAHHDVHATHSRIRDVLDEYQDRYSVGEIHESDWGEWAKYFGQDLDQFHQPYNFSLLWSDWTAGSFRHKIMAQEDALPEGAWPNHVLGNHDEPRLVTRYGAGRARAAAVLLLTLRGTPTIYYGDEIGMEDGAIAPGKEQDPWGQIYPDLNRDGCRTPMRWESTPGAGFTESSVEPWLPVGDASVSVEAQSADDDSMLALYRRLLALRSESAALRLGDIAMGSSNEENILTYRRSFGDQSILIAINFTEEQQKVDLEREVSQVLGTHGERHGAFQTITLEPNEAIITR